MTNQPCPFPIGGGAKLKARNMSRITPAYFPANRALGLRFRGALLSLLPFCATWLEAASLGTAFTYQGRLSSSTGPAAGWFDLRFALFDAGSAGSQTGPALTNSAVGVTNGLFAATLDFGTTVFDGTARWLEIGVRTNGNGAFTTLTPRLAVGVLATELRTARVCEPTSFAVRAHSTQPSTIASCTTGSERGRWLSAIAWAMTNAMEVSSVHSPGCHPKPPPPIMPMGSSRTSAG